MNLWLGRRCETVSVSSEDRNSDRCQSLPNLCASITWELGLLVLRLVKFEDFTSFFEKSGRRATIFCSKRGALRGKRQDC